MCDGWKLQLFLETGGRLSASEISAVLLFIIGRLDFGSMTTFERKFLLNAKLLIFETNKGGM